MPRFKRSILFLVLAGAAVFSATGQTESQIQGPDVKRVGAHINCQCGSCKSDVNCEMSGGQCHFCKPTRTKIFQMQQAGMSDNGIIDALKKEFGEKIFRPEPDSSLWLVPYLTLAGGVLLVALILMKMRGGARKRGLRPAAAGGPPVDDDPTLARYRDAIEKDTSRLD